MATNLTLMQQFLTLFNHILAKWHSFAHSAVAGIDPSSFPGLWVTLSIETVMLDFLNPLYVRSLNGFSRIFLLPLCPGLCLNLARTFTVFEISGSNLHIVFCICVFVCFFISVKTVLQHHYLEVLFSVIFQTWCLDSCKLKLFVLCFMESRCYLNI